MTDIEKNNSFVELDAQDLEQVSGGKTTTVTCSVS